MPASLAKSQPPSARILIADDDPLFRESLAGNLLAAGYGVEGFSDGQEILDWLGQGHGCDLVLLDWKMPKINGIEVLLRMREANYDYPVIFLTVLTDQFYEEAALHGGAVDFVEKSRSFSILAKRIELTLQAPRGQLGNDPEDVAEIAEDVTIGPLHLAVDTSRARWQGKEVRLSYTEFRMVHCLASRAGADVGYRELYDMVHGKGFYAGHGTDGYRSNVRTFIKRIRRKFKEIDPAFDGIENYPGFGYRWRPDE